MLFDAEFHAGLPVPENSKLNDVVPVGASCGAVRMPGLLPGPIAPLPVRMPLIMPDPPTSAPRATVSPPARAPLRANWPASTAVCPV